MVIISLDEFREEESAEGEESAARRGCVEVDEDTIQALTDLLSYLSNERVPHPAMHCPPREPHAKAYACCGDDGLTRPP